MVTRCPYVYWPQFTLHWKTAYVHILPSNYRAAMEIIQIYAISVGSVFLFLLLISPRSYVKLLITAVSLPTYKHLIYPRVIRRYRYVGPWSRASVLLQLCYILVNTFCISFNVPNVFTAGSRAAHLSLINMVPNFAGPHLSFLADILGVPLSTYQSIHRSSGIMSSLLLLFHIITIPGSQNQFPLQLAENLWGLFVSHWPIPIFKYVGNRSRH